jgi:hypothetical protein
MPADSSTRDDAFRSPSSGTVELIAGLAATVDGSRPGRTARELGGCCGCRGVDQDPSTSSIALAYKNPSLQNLRVKVILPWCGMMACAATGAVVSAYEPVNL